MIPFSAKTLALLVLCAFAVSGCYRTYSADPITATVLEADTGKPIAGVVVVALWEMQGGLEGGNVEGNVMVLETVTDTNGVFYFPAWGPKRVSITPLSDARLKTLAPWIILFKSGYEIKTFTNALTRANLRGDKSHLTSDLNGKTIGMKKFNGTIENYALYLDSYFPSYAFEGQCEWQKIPRMLLAIRDQSIINEKAMHYASGNLYWRLVTNDGNGCGSVDEYLNRHEK